MDLNAYRKEIDQLDQTITESFSRRMAVAAEIAAYKKENGIAVYDGKREREKLLAIYNAAPDSDKPYITQLYSLIFELSRSYQTRLIGDQTELILGR